MTQFYTLHFSFTFQQQHYTFVRTYVGCKPSGTFLMIELQKLQIKLMVLSVKKIVSLSFCFFCFSVCFSVSCLDVLMAFLDFSVWLFCCLFSVCSAIYVLLSFCRSVLMPFCLYVSLSLCLPVSLFQSRCLTF